MRRRRKNNTLLTDGRVTRFGEEDDDDSVNDEVNIAREEDEEEEEDEYQSFAAFGGRTTPATTTVTSERPKKAERERKKAAKPSDEEQKAQREAEEAELKKFVEEQRKKFEEIDRVELPCVDDTDVIELPKSTETAETLRTTPALPAAKRRSIDHSIEETTTPVKQVSSKQPPSLDISPIKRLSPKSVSIDAGAGDVSFDTGLHQSNSHSSNSGIIDKRGSEPSGMTSGLSISPIKAKTGAPHALMDDDDI